MSIQYGIRVNEYGQYQVYATSNGIAKVDIGVPFGTPTGAIEYSNILQKQADEAAATSAAEYEDD